MTIRNLDALFRPQALLVLGAPKTPGAETLLRNAAACLPAGQRWLLGAEREGWQNLPAEWPHADLAILLDPQIVHDGLLARLATMGCRALIVACDAPDLEPLLAEGRARQLRVLGPRSGGVAASWGSLNLSTLPLSPLPGKLALIAQSQSVAAAALDWATGRRIGFSWLAMSGAEADADVGDLLDYAALDPHTRAVVLQLGQLRNGRKFMSAARACARIKPVVVLQTRAALDGLPAGADPVRSTAFRRAGMVECGSLAGLFDALAALEHLPVLASNRVVVLGNGAGVCALGADALLRHGLTPVDMPAGIRGLLAAAVPQLRFPPGAVDLGGADTAQVVQVLRDVLAVPEAGAVLFLRSPTAEAGHATVAEALAGVAIGERLLTVWLGLETALPARALSAQAHLASFSSADAAARALSYRWGHRRTQELLTQTPAAAGLIETDRDAIRARLDGRSGDSVDENLDGDLLAAYGLRCSTEPSLYAPLEVRIETHAELGMVLRLRPECPGVETAFAQALPPLDNLLAQRVLEEAGYRNTQELDAALIRLAELVIEQPRIAALSVRLGSAADRSAWVLPGVELRLRETLLAERTRLVLAPYPARLVHSHACHIGSRFVYRPVRPADEPALLQLLAQIPPEDIRLRFFAHIRHFSHAMAARMTQIDYDRELSLVAVQEDEPQRLVAIATLIADADKARAEFAVLVRHELGGRGVGRHLMECLLRHARHEGIGLVYGEVLSENAGMRGLARALGFRERFDPEDRGCVHVELPVVSIQRVA